MDKVVHFEIPADNTERAKRFYSKVFGWDAQDMPEMSYTILKTAITEKDGKIKEVGMGAINGGMMKRTTHIRSPVITIGVGDIEKAIKEAEKNGGKVVVGKMSVGTMGFSAYVRDTEGNVIGLWQPLMPSS